MKSFTTPAALLTLVATCTAGPLVSTIEKRVVYDPQVLYPAGGTVWTLGQSHNVTWNVTDAPPENQISNRGAIYLRKGSRTITNHTLAQGFDLRSGRQEITIPTDIQPGTDYRIVLFGDSGNFGPQFTITATKPVFWGYPPVLYPYRGTTWKAGSTHNVTWSTANAPADIANKGAIFLCQNRTVTAPECENTVRLTTSDFDLSTGRHEVTIPSTVKAGKYQITLFGYYNNHGEPFSITSS